MLSAEPIWKVSEGWQLCSRCSCLLGEMQFLLLFWMRRLRLDQTWMHTCSLALHVVLLGAAPQALPPMRGPRDGSAHREAPWPWGCMPHSIQTGAGAQSQLFSPLRLSLPAASQVQYSGLLLPYLPSKADSRGPIVLSCPPPHAWTCWDFPVFRDSRPGEQPTNRPSGWSQGFAGREHSLALGSPCDFGLRTSLSPGLGTSGTPCPFTNTTVIVNGAPSVGSPTLALASLLHRTFSLPWMGTGLARLLPCRVENQELCLTQAARIQ